MSEEAILTDLLKILGGILSGGIGVAIVNKRLLGKDKEVDVAAQLRDELRLSETDSRNRAVVTESRMWGSCPDLRNGARRTFPAACKMRRVSTCHTGAVRRVEQAA
jgi:hypothetical protein